MGLPLCHLVEQKVRHSWFRILRHLFLCSIAIDFQVPYSYRVVHSRDLVVHLPPLGFKGFRHHRYEVATILFPHCYSYEQIWRISKAFIKCMHNGRCSFRALLKTVFSSARIANTFSSSICLFIVEYLDLETGWQNIRNLILKCQGWSCTAVKGNLDLVQDPMCTFLRHSLHCNCHLQLTYMSSYGLSVGKAFIPSGVKSDDMLGHRLMLWRVVNCFIL